MVITTALHAPMQEAISGSTALVQQAQKHEVPRFNASTAAVQGNPTGVHYPVLSWVPHGAHRASSSCSRAEGVSPTDEIIGQAPSAKC